MTFNDTQLRSFFFVFESSLLTIFELTFWCSSASGFARNAQLFESQPHHERADMHRTFAQIINPLLVRGFLFYSLAKMHPSVRLFHGWEQRNRFHCILLVLCILTVASFQKPETTRIILEITCLSLDTIFNLELQRVDNCKRFVFNCSC